MTKTSFNTSHPFRYAKLVFENKADEETALKPEFLSRVPQKLPGKEPVVLRNLMACAVQPGSSGSEGEIKTETEVITA